MSDLEQAKKELASDLGSPKVEALVEAMFLAATADGEFSQEETQQFAATIAALTDKKLDEKQLFHLVGRLAGYLREQGRTKRMAAIAERLPVGKGRETAIILAASITASDGEIQSSENDFVADLAEALGVESGRASDLVMKIHRG